MPATVQLHASIYHGCAAAALFLLVLGVSDTAPAQSQLPQDLFHLFTQHIQRQVSMDKRAFAEASECTQWFYRRKNRTPDRPPVEGVHWSLPSRFQLHGAHLLLAVASDCEARYPGGLASVREDFSHSQSALSLSLTFYQFALVSDGNDDGEYNASELHDVLGSLNLPIDSALSGSTHLAALTDTFDQLYQTAGMERLMASMGKLYEQGYRLTGQDRAELNRVME